MVSKEDVAMILALKPEEVTLALYSSLIVDKAIRTGNSVTVKKAKYKIDELVSIPPGAYDGKNDEIKTHLGRLLFNVYMLKDFGHIIGYVNEPVNNDKLNAITSVFSTALKEDRITVENMIDYVDRLQFYYSLAPIIASSISLKTSVPDERVMARKEKLVKENEAILKKGGQEAAVVAASIEKELLALAKEQLSGDYGMDMYDSGSKSSFGNNYKNMAIMKGPIMDPNTGEYVISTSNYMNGIKAEEIPAYANSIVIGAYAKGINTQVGGYLVKKFLAAFQCITLDKDGTDCGSKATLDMLLTPENLNLHLDSWIVDGNNLVTLTKENAPKYMNSVIKKRSPKFCRGEKLCSKCAGTYFYTLGMENVGLAATRPASSIMNKSLKKFHDATVKVYTIKDESDLFI